MKKAVLLQPQIARFSVAKTESSVTLCSLLSSVGQSISLLIRGSQVQVLKGAQFLCFMLLIFWPRKSSPLLRGFFIVACRF